MKREVFGKFEIVKWMLIRYYNILNHCSLVELKQEMKLITNWVEITSLGIHLQMQFVSSNSW